MTLIPPSQTEANLLRAFACEMLASRRCLAVAAISEAEGDRRAAMVFRHLAGRRAGHAEEHLRMLDGLADAPAGHATGDTSDHLRTAVAREIERGALYAGMARTARDEGFNEIAEWFEMLAKGGRLHARRFERVLASVEERGFGSYDSRTAAPGTCP